MKREMLLLLFLLSSVQKRKENMKLPGGSGRAPGALWADLWGWKFLYRMLGILAPCPNRGRPYVEEMLPQF